MREVVLYIACTSTVMTNPSSTSFIFLSVKYSPFLHLAFVFRQPVCLLTTSFFTILENCCVV